MKRSPAREARMLEAAQALFLESGLRGATMEAIAKRAGVAKPTLYAYFPDKEAMFRAVIATVIERMKSAFEVALAHPGAPEDRVARALADKYGVADALLEGSPHAQELTSDQIVRTGAEFQALHAWMVGRIADVLREAGRPDPEWRAQLVIDCCDGLMAKDEFAALGPKVAFVARRLLGEPQEG
ncbi:helix-turn-helix domain containing protein [Albimonas sp. CAU 1670]|uniref:TetR/AcrR family transcriptional regulator n=1 Tax=Albimonas sp. CAU 1670 TaxID=3032599 RepID=UPI0023D9BACF|nr:TetR/AcrR family transcriptional regulator [Albimonas sp. CAU 1670]MDF2235204.1 helix-turn-helix domain containing protein [Albimonas sp. CAU 1670]